MELNTIDEKDSLIWIELKFAHLSLVKQKRKNRNILPQSSQGKKIFSLLFEKEPSLDHSNLFQPTRILQ